MRTTPFRVGPVLFQPVPGGPQAERAIYLDAHTARAGPVRLGRKAASLALLHTVVFPADTDARKAYLNRFLRPVDGVAAAVARITYAGGEGVDVPIRVGMEVGSWLPTRGAAYLHRCPYIRRLATQRCRRESPGGADVCLYVYEWPNPHPARRIDAIELTHTGVEAAYALLAVSARAPRRTR